MAHQGRLYTKNTGEGGADVVYDGAAKSSFDAALSGKHSATWEARAERFKVEQMAPEVDYRPAGIADSAAGSKPTATWAANKPRFEDPKPQPVQNYNTTVSDFDKAARVKPAVTPERPKDRSAGWITSADQVNSPPPAPIPGAFDAQLKKTSPSPFAHHGGDRFKDLYTVSSHGEPSASTSNVSDFDKAARNTKPSPSSMTGGDRFKAAYDVPSHGDPGAGQSSVDIERQRMEAKLARQKAQAEADRARALE